MIGVIIAWWMRWRWIVIAALWIGSLGGVAYKTWDITKTNYEARNNKAALVKSEKRNEIRNNRPDDDALFDGLWNDPNW